MKRRTEIPHVGDGGPKARRDEGRNQTLDGASEMARRRLALMSGSVHQSNDRFTNPPPTTVSVAALVPHHAYRETFHRQGRVNPLEFADAVAHQSFRDRSHEIGLRYDIGYKQE